MCVCVCARALGAAERARLTRRISHYSLPPSISRVCFHGPAQVCTDNLLLLSLFFSSADSIFYDDQTHVLFATFKYVGYDYAGDMERMRENPKVREWWKMTDAFQESTVPGATSSESGEPAWWKPLEEVFYQA